MLRLIAQVLGVENRTCSKQTVTTYLMIRPQKAGEYSGTMYFDGRTPPDDHRVIPSSCFFLRPWGAVLSHMKYIVPHDFDGTVNSLIADYELNDAIDDFYIPASHKVLHIRLLAIQVECTRAS